MRETRRTCVGCRRVASSATLVRFVRTDDGELIDGAKQSGRGAWVCRSTAGCFDQAVRRGMFPRVLRGEVSAGSVEEMRARLGRLLGWEVPTA